MRDFSRKVFPGSVLRSVSGGVFPAPFSGGLVPGDFQQTTHIHHEVSNGFLAFHIGSGFGASGGWVR